MTRRRSRAPGRVRPDRRRSLLILCLAAVFVVAACGGTSESTIAPSDGVRPTSQPSGPPPDPGTPEPATPEPGTPDPATPAPPTLEPPTLDPSDGPSTSPSSDAGGAAACAGTDDNREFFASIADVVSWSVYCPVLPSGWFVDSGQYRLAGGGWLEIAYRGPGGARLELREGTACIDTSCLPAGDDLGPAAFGDRDGAMSRLGDGRLAVVVGPADGVTWVAIGSGIGEAAFGSITADLALVGG